MKKLLLMSALIIIISTGCKKANKIEIITCKGDLYIEETRVSLIVQGESINDKTNTLTSVFTFENAEVAKKYCVLYNRLNNLEKEEEKKTVINCKEKEIVFKKYELMINENDRQNIMNKNKENFIDFMKKQNMICE